MKRTFDVGLALALLLIMLPLLLAIAVAVKIDGPGPVFFRAWRIGARGRPFPMLKFRKMMVGAAGVPLTKASDLRFTATGKLLAKLKFDELPQLWNVLKGDMSFVGPRPEDSRFVALFPTEYAEIHSVAPGITGLSQLAFAKESELLDRDDTLEYYVEQLLPNKVAIDVFYARNRSFVGDLKIFAWTFLAVLRRRDVAVHRETGRLSVRRRTQTAADSAQTALEPTQTARAQ